MRAAERAASRRRPSRARRHALLDGQLPLPSRTARHAPPKAPRTKFTSSDAACEAAADAHGESLFRATLAVLVGAAALQALTAMKAGARER